MRTASKYAYYYSNSGGGDGIVGVNTTSDGKQPFLIIGDSNADGRGATIPTVAADTLYLWNGTDITEITTQSVANDDNTKGSIWQQLATDYKANSTRKIVLINGAKGGAEFYPNGDNDNFYTSGTLYAAAQDKVTDALDYLNLTKLRAIIVNLGLNDVRSANTTADIQTGIDSLFTRLTTDYPGVPILVIQIGRSESATDNSKFYTIRKYLVEKAEALDDVYICGNAAVFAAISGGYNGDNLHYSQASNNDLGSQLAKWFKNSSISDKWARAIISSMFADLSTARKTLIEDFISTIGADYHKLDSLHFWKVSDADDILQDWTFLGFGQNVGCDVTLNSHIRTGTSKSFIGGYNPAVKNLRSSQNDTFTIGKIKTNNTPPGAAGLFGISTPFYRCIQGNSNNLEYVVNDGTTRSYTGLSSFQNGKSYGAGRNSTTKYLFIDGAVVDSFTQSSTGTVNRYMRWGATDSGSLGNILDAELEWGVSGKYSTIDLSNLTTALDTLADSW